MATWKPLSGVAVDDRSPPGEAAYLDFKPSIFAVYTLLAVAFVVLVHLLQIHYPIAYVALITENYWGENASFFGFLAAALLLGLLALQNGPWPRRVIWAAAAVVVAFIAFEEISWGMWVHKMGPPAWLKEMNTQNELNLHNIKGVDKELTHVITAWLLAGWAVLSLTAVLARRRLGASSLLAVLPIFPLRLLPFTLVTAWVFGAKPFIKSEEIGELALAILALMWACDLYACFSKRPARRLEPLLRRRLVPAAAVAVLTVLTSAAVKAYFPGALSYRLNLSAGRDYPDRGMTEQSRELFRYIFENPQYMEGGTVDFYQRVFGEDAELPQPD